MFFSTKVFLLAQALFAPCDMHFFDGEELDCEFFFDYQPYDSYEEFSPDFWDKFEIEVTDNDEE